MSITLRDPLHQLLVTLCHRDADARITDGDIALISDPRTWKRLLAQAEAHRVQGLLLTAIERSTRRRPNLATALRAAWAAPLQLLRRQSAGWGMEQERVLARLESRGFAPVVLKGSALRRTTYAEPAARPVVDLDLLLPLETIAGACSALEELGYHDPSSTLQRAVYERHHFHFQMRHHAGFLVELHWALTAPGPYPQIDPIRVMRDAHSVSGATRPFLAPRAEHMVLHLTSQCADDTFARLGRIADIDRVISATGSAFEWEELRVTAVSGHLQAAVGLALRLAELLFDTPIPDGFLSSLAIAPFTRINLAATKPVSWLLDRRGERIDAAFLTMQAWLQSGPGAKRDILLKLLGIRTDPTEVLGEPRVPGDPPLTEPPRRLIVPFLKVAGYQMFIWISALGAITSAPGRDELRFWTRTGGPNGSS